MAALDAKKPGGPPLNSRVRQGKGKAMPSEADEIIRIKVLDHVVEDPKSGRHTVWLAQYEHAEPDRAGRYRAGLPLLRSGSMRRPSVAGPFRSPGSGLRSAGWNCRVGGGAIFRPASVRRQNRTCSFPASGFHQIRPELIRLIPPWCPCTKKG